MQQGSHNALAATGALLIVGGGIGGLASALACAQAGWQVTVLEQAGEFAEFGAGIQLGPNAVRVLHGWGLAGALAAVAARPAALEVLDAGRGHGLAQLPLGDAMERQFGAPYLTIARADLQQVLLAAVRAHPHVALHTGAQFESYEETRNGVTVRAGTGEWEAQALVGADGIWSAVRQQLLADLPPRVSGHLAYRAMVPQAELPAPLRLDRVRVWMGPRFHCVQYPVRGGEWLNVVLIVQGAAPHQLQSWDHSGNQADLLARLAGAAPALRALVQSVPHWRLWPLCDRPPMQSAAEHARGRVALVGDAAHPMRPYLAQGAGMAIEDSATLARCLGTPRTAGQADPVPLALGQFAAARWQRNARVQARAIRNGEIFHFQGAAALARNGALRVLGARLLALSWLYAGPP